jgi:hypothetical protein
MFKTALLAATVALASSAAMAGAPASLTENRGYENCLSAAQAEYRSLSVIRNYYINEGADTRTYYLNGFAVHDGSWTEMRVSCDTSPSGLRLMTMNVEPGRYLGVRARAADIAQY